MAFTSGKTSGVLDYEIKSHRLLVPFTITGAATPAQKTHSTDLPESLVLSTEGKTSTASGIDSGCNFTTEVDASGIFGILCYNLGTVSKLLGVELMHLSSGTASVSKKGASSTGVTASGNIAVSVDWDGDLSTTSLTATLAIDYKVSKD